MIKNLAIFMITASTVLCATWSMSSDKVKELSIYDVMKHGSWEKFKKHVDNCPFCAPAGYETKKMCQTGYLLADDARPYFTTDEMRMWAQGLVVIKVD